MNQSMGQSAPSGPDVARWVETYVGASLVSWSALHGGDEGIVYRVDLASESFVVRVAPQWETHARLEWAAQVATHAARSVPSVVAPLPIGSAHTTSMHGRAATLFPFVQGSHLNRDHPPHRYDAAKQLAAIHSALLDFPIAGPSQNAVAHMPSELFDRRLDEWLVGTDALLNGVAHGDYYRRNLLCRNDAIVGIVDWVDASRRPLILEVAGATFELCKDDSHNLHFDRADEFILNYQEANGPVPDGMALT